MTKPEPLKGKHRYSNQISNIPSLGEEMGMMVFKEEDIRSAVEWCILAMEHWLPKGSGKERARMILEKTFEDVMK